MRPLLLAAPSLSCIAFQRRWNVHRSQYTAKGNEQENTRQQRIVVLNTHQSILILPSNQPSHFASFGFLDLTPFARSPF